MLASTASPPRRLLGCTCHDLGEGVVRIAVAGELDLSSAPGLGRLLHSTLADAAYCVLDLDAVTFVDVAGAAALRFAGRVAGHRLIVVNPQPHVRETLTAIGMQGRVKVVPAPAGLSQRTAAA